MDQWSRALQDRRLLRRMEHHGSLVSIALEATMIMISVARDMVPDNASVYSMITAAAG